VPASDPARAPMLRRLALSGLGPEDAAVLKLKPYPDAPPALPFRGPGFSIPYLNNGGTNFFRFRYLPPEPRSKGRPVRYSQPPSTGNHLYVPANYDWGAWRGQPADKRVLLVTEGELKAACAAKNGLSCVALGGVYNFKDKRHALLPEIARFCAWDGLRAYILYDSDALTNPNIVAAENQLARELLGLGAVPHVVRLPALSAEGKTGLDDFLVNEKEGGLERLTDLVFSTEAWELGRVLHAMNERFVFVKDPGVVMDLADWQLMAPEKFAGAIFANQYYEAQVERNGRTVAVRKKAAPAWLGWERRTQARRLCYAPGLDRVTPGGLLNTWRGWGVPEDQVKKGDVSPWAGLLDFLFLGAGPGHRAWFERWCAFHVQRPNVKMLTAVLFWGRHKGTGKTLVGHTLRHVYGRNYFEIEEGSLLGEFNDWAKERQLVQGDEIAGSFDKRGSADRLKGFVTRQEVTISEKYLPRYTIEDVISYFFTSNHPNSFFLDDDERRYFVHEVRGEPLPMGFYKRYESWYQGDGPDGQRVPGPGIGPLMWHLRNLDLGDFDPKAAAPRTEAMVNMASSARFPVEDWARAVADDPDSVAGFPVGMRLMTPQELWRAWMAYNGGPDRTTAQHVSAALAGAGLRRAYGGEKVRCAAGKAVLWAVRDRERVLGMGHGELARIRDEDMVAGRARMEGDMGAPKKL
jgi:hypothetical protein